MVTATRYKAPAGHRGVASLIHFDYQDGGAAALVQDSLRLARFMDGYGRKVLLKRQAIPSFLDLSEKDEKTADIVLPPTKSNFFGQLIKLAEEGWRWPPAWPSSATAWRARWPLWSRCTRCCCRST